MVVENTILQTKINTEIYINQAIQDVCTNVKSSMASLVCFMHRGEVIDLVLPPEKETVISFC
jgi:hypothetical protein